MTTEEGNKLIAEFDGAKFNPEFPTIIYHAVSGEPIRYISDLKYHISWDWLMPVVEKILVWYNEEGIKEKYVFDLNHINPCIFRLTIFDVKETAWLAVVEFIKWYNQNLKP